MDCNVTYIVGNYYNLYFFGFGDYQLFEIQ